MLNPDLPHDHFLLDRLVREVSLIPIDRGVPGQDSGIHESGALTGNRRVSLRMNMPPGYLAPFNTMALEVENLSEGTALVGLNMQHCTDPAQPDSTNISFTGGREPVDTAQRKTILFPFESFGFYGKHTDWANVLNLEIFACRDKDQVTDKPLKIKFISLSGQLVERPPGPRLQLTGLQHVLKSEIGALFKDGGDECFMNSFLKTSDSPDRIIPFSRPDKSLGIPSPEPYPASSADEILDGLVMGEQLSGKIDWKYSPSGAHEWTHFLNRHHFLRKVALQASRKDGCRYADFLLRTIEEWISLNPTPVGSNGGAGVTWETLTAAWRLREWFWIAGLCWPLPWFPRNTRLKMLCSIWEHARSLMDHQGHPNNWLIVESGALAVAGLLFPEFAEAKAWFQTGSKRIYDQLEKQFFCDGAHFELSPLYHSICLNSLVEFSSVARYCRIEVHERLDSTIRRALAFLAALKRPNGTWPSINDSGSCMADFSGIFSRAEEFVGNIEPEKDLRSLNATLSQPGLEHYPDSGFVIMRSSEAGVDNALVFRAGPAGAAHVHGDTLSLDVTFNGHPGLVDPGITAYAPGPLSEYYRSAGSHNVVLLDNTAPERAGLNYQIRIAPAGDTLRVDQSPELMVATGINTLTRPDQTSDIKIFRSVIFVKGMFWIIRDLISGHGSHTISTLWKCYPSDVSLSESNMVASVANDDGLDFKIVPIGLEDGLSCNVAVGEAFPAKGWVSINGKDCPAPLIEYILNCELPKYVHWGLFPSSSATSLPTGMDFKKMEDESVRIVFRFAHRNDWTLKIGQIETVFHRKDGRSLLDLVTLTV